MTKENHGLLKKTMNTHFLVHTGNIINEAGWLYDVLFLTSERIQTIPARYGVARAKLIMIGYANLV